VNQLLVVYLFFSASVKAILLPPLRQPLRPYTITTSTKAAFAKLPQNPIRDRIINDKRGLARDGNQFTLHLTNGHQVKLVSKPGPPFEEDKAELSYQGKLPYLHKYLLQVGQWESSICLLIDERTGTIDTLQSYPSSSLGLQRLAVMFQEYPMEYGLNGVDIYTVQSGRVHRQFRFKQGKWVPYGLAWLNDRSFILKCLPIAVEEKINSTADKQRIIKHDTQFFYLQVTCK
jgi:hypothetical protein